MAELYLLMEICIKCMFTFTSMITQRRLLYCILAIMMMLRENLLMMIKVVI